MYPRSRGHGKTALHAVFMQNYFMLKKEPTDDPKEFYGDEYTIMKLKAIRHKKKTNDENSIDEILYVWMRRQQMRDRFPSYDWNAEHYASPDAIDEMIQKLNEMTNPGIAAIGGP